MPDILQMRNDLYARYPGKAWKKTVDAMPDNQVVAIWYSMLQRDQQSKSPKKVEQSPTQQPIQLRLF